MSDEESFLARWARRKRSAAVTTRGQPKPKNTAGDAASETPAASLPSGETQSRFDPASLPPIEAIDAGSDVRQFLAAGMPADLTRAALRRAWSVDPMIRDFIGLSENSWDFNAPGGAPGFGSLTAEEAQRLLARMMDATESPAAGWSSDHVTEPAGEAYQLTSSSVSGQVKAIRDAEADDHNPVLDPKPSNIAAQHEKGEHEPRPFSPRRRHGSALPD